MSLPVRSTLLSILFLSAAVTPVQSQDRMWEWTWVYPTPFGGEVDFVQFHDPSFAVARADSAYYRSYDGGRTWTPDHPDSAVHSVHRVGADRLVGVSPGPGDLPVIARSSDNGRSWHRDTTAILPNRVRKLVFLDSSRAYLRGDQFRNLMRTVDGGRSWETVPSTPTNPKDFVAFPDGRLLVAASEVFLSTDGGNTSTKTGHSGITAFSFAPDGVNGWMMSSVWILATVDGGRTWTNAGKPFVGAILSIARIDARRGVATGSHGFAVTDDAGMTWQTIDTGSRTIIGHDGSSIYMTTAREGVVERYDFERNQIDVFRPGLPLVAGGAAFGTTRFGLLGQLTDPGRTWLDLDLVAGTHRFSSIDPSAQLWQGVDAVGDTVWAIDAYSLYASYDRGSTWNRLLLNAGWVQTGIGMIDGTSAVTTSIKGHVLVRESGAVRTPIPLKEGLRAVRFLNRRFGYIAETGVSTDGGATWRTIEHGPGGGPHPVPYYVHEDPETEAFEVYGVRFDGIYVSSDGGVTYDKLFNATPTTPARSIVMFGSRRGFGLAAPGLVETTDGGETWEVIAPMTVTGIERLDCPSTDVCFAYGNSGVLRFKRPGSMSVDDRVSGPDQYQVPDVVARSDGSTITISGIPDGLPRLGLRMYGVDGRLSFGHSDLLVTNGRVSVPYDSESLPVGPYLVELVTTGDHWTVPLIIERGTR